MQKFRPERQIGVGGLVLGEREKRYLHEVIASNRLSYGPMTQRLEKEFAELHDCRYAVFCNSGTSALHIAMAALKERHGWRDGDEVIVPAVTFVATANIVLHNRMVPVFVDVDAKTYNIDPGLIEAKITPRTKAIIPVHLMGLPCDMDPIMDIAKRHGLRVVEDSCETMFATYKGKRVGSFGDIGCFSTYIAHFIVTGVGGFATTNDPELAVMLKSLMNHGRDSIYLSISDDQGVSKEKLFEIASKRFSFVHLGHSFRCTELEAAIGLGQLEQREAIIKTRKENAAYLVERLKLLADHLQLPFIPPDRDHMFMLFPIVLRDRSKRELVNYLEEHLIETRDLMPLVNQPVYKKMFGDIEDNYPVAKWLNASGFYIGCHQYLTEEERDYIADTIVSFFSTKSR
jgi:dTDP-4-amino-4,6-dideoxygalactose transaminase